MNSKKKVVIGVTIVAILIVVLFLFKGEDGSSQSDKNGWDTGSATGLLFTNKMTDEIEIEVMTQIDTNQSEEEIQKKVELVLNKYGVSKEEYGRYSEELYKDEARLDAIMQKASQKTQESMKK